MDAVVVLCHFCETHGPAVIMCTQPLRQTPPGGSSASRKNSMGGGGGGSTPHASISSGGGSAFHVSTTPTAASLSTSHDGTLWPNPDLLHASLSDIMASAVLPQSTGAVQDTSGMRGSQGNQSCRACSIITRDELGFVSHDSAANIDYVSTQFPGDTELHKAVRTACMRSLSCEVIPEREGPVYFGDDINRHVISYNFFVKDSMARGSQVRYSFLLISWNQIFLLNLWPFVVKSFQTMSKRIQEAALRVYEEETASGSSSTSANTATNATAAATAAAAAAALRSVTPPSTAGNSASLRVCRTPPPPSSAAAAAAAAAAAHHTYRTYHHQQQQHQHRQAAVGYATASTTPPPTVRTAPQLSSSQAVAAGSVLSMGSGQATAQRKMKISEMEIRSLADLTRDDQVYYRLHAWFTWLLRVARRNWTPVELTQGPVDEDEALAEERRNDDVSSAFSMRCNIGPSSSGYANAPLVDPAELVVGSDLGWTDGTPEVEAAVQMRLLTHLYKCIGEESFQRLIYRLGTGHQVIVRPLDRVHVASFTATALARLLPRGCAKLVIESPTYYPVTQCNVLGLNVNVTLSKFAPSTLPYVILQVSLMSPTFGGSRTGSSSSVSGGGSRVDERLFVGAGGAARLLQRPLPSPTASTSSSDSETKFDQLNFAVCFGQAQEPFSDAWEMPCSRSSSCSESGGPVVGTTVTSFATITTTATSPWGLPATTAGVSYTSCGAGRRTGAPAPAAVGAAAAALNSTFARQVTDIFRMSDPAHNCTLVLQPSTMGLALMTIRRRWIEYARTLYGFQHCKKVASNVEEASKKCFHLLASTYHTTPDDEDVVHFFQQALSNRTRQDVCHPTKSPPSTSTVVTARLS